MLPPITPALSSPNVSRSMYTAESSDKEQTYELAFSLQRQHCLLRTFLPAGSSALLLGVHPHLRAPVGSSTS